MEITIVNKPVIDQRRTSRVQSECVNQLLYGQSVRILRTRAGRAYVESDDKYKGWVSLSHLSGIKPIVPTHFVSVPIAAVYDESGRLCDKLSYGTRLPVRKASDDFGRIDIGTTGRYISYGCLTRMHSSKRKWPAIKGALDILIGTPYVWGGRSGFGLDCSGMIQLVFNSLGYTMPRDSVEQRNVGRKSTLQNAKPGDLIFSPGHVAVYYGRGKIIHASRRAGGLYVENLLPKLTHARTDIYDKVELVKRVIR